MVAALIVVGSLFLLWVLMNLKTSRPDGVWVRRVHPYRKMLGYIMPTRNESVVYFDSYVDAEELLEFLEKKKESHGANVTHAVVAACAIGLAENPKMNRFVAGRRLYERKGRWITFSMKRKRLDKEAKLAAVKLEVFDGESFGEICERINRQIGVERSESVTYTDKELGILTSIPRPVLNVSIRLFRWLDYHNLLPASFIRNDAMFTSAFVANLGSLGMGAGYHHLYEWGTCPLFVMVGAVEERAVVRDGQVVARPMLHLRFSYDERIDDGLTARDGMRSVLRVLERPFECLKS